MTEDRWQQLIAAHQLDRLSKADWQELETWLLASASARQRFQRACRTDTQLRRLAEAPTLATTVSDPGTPPQTRSTANWIIATLLAALLLCLGVLAAAYAKRPQMIATLTSAEHASWESTLPTEVGSDLGRGTLRLSSGIATIRMRSGAELTLEAPAELTLKDAMHTRLLSGSMVVDAPPSAKGFVVETPNGYAVDHGTRFAVQALPKDQRADFEVLSGEISVHHNTSGDELRLFEDQGAMLSQAGIDDASDTFSEGILKPENHNRLIETDGLASSVIRNNDRALLRPDLLMAKREKAPGKYDRKSIFSFSLEGVDLATIQSAQLHLNLVPSGLGFAARLPKTNRFGIYAVRDETRESWNAPSTWNDLPDVQPSDLLGTFELARSQNRGRFGINTDALLEFLQADTTGRVSLILTRQTPENDPSGLVHAFASDSHPEASGPILELSTTNPLHSTP